MFKTNIVYAFLDNFHEKFDELVKKMPYVSELEMQLDTLLDGVDLETRRNIENVLLHLDVSYQDVAFAIGLETGIDLKKNIEGSDIAEKLLDTTI